MPKLLLPLILCGILSIPALAKKATYYDTFHRKTSKEGAAYYMTSEKEGKKFRIKKYDPKSNKLLEEAECSSIKPKLVYDGRCVTYFEDGTMHTDFNYKDGKLFGLCKEHDQDDHTTSLKYFDGEQRKQIQFWDGDQPLLTNGSGEYRKFLSSQHETRYALWKDSTAVVCFYIRHHEADTIYTCLQQEAEYPGGLEAVYQEVGKFLQGKYPAQARRMGIQGRVFVELIINKNGAVESAKAIKKIGGGCDELAEEVFKNQKLTWSPGLHNGRPVKERVYLPVVFRLN